MPDTIRTPGFRPSNRAFDSTFRPGHLSLGLFVPLEAYPDSAVPTMHDHLKRAQLAEALGFAALWLRDVPFNVPSFGDAGQTFDPFVYLGLLATKMVREAFGVQGSNVGIGADILCRLDLSDEFARCSGQYFENDAGRFAEPPLRRRTPSAPPR